MKEIPIVFESKGKQIIGVLHLPSKKNVPVVIFLHGWAMGKTGNLQFTFVKAAREFCKNDIAVLRFDFRGVGDSEGEFDNYNQTSMLEDLEVALNFVQTIKEIDKKKIGVLGWSMGGSTAIIGASKNKSIKCVVLWASPADYRDLWFPAQLEELKKRGYMIIDYFYTGLPTTWKSVVNEFKWTPWKEIKKVNTPILIINGTEDNPVYPNQAEKLYKNANKPKKLVLIKGANHGFYGEQHKKQLLDESLNWFKKWL